MEQLKQALGAPTPIEIAGKPVSVRCIRLAELPEVLDAMTPAARQALDSVNDLAAWAVESGLVVSGESVTLDGALAVQLLRKGVPLLSTLPACLRFLTRLSAICSDEPSEWVGGLDPAEGLKLIAAVIEVNTDFFVHRLRPVLKGELSRLAGRLSSSGLARKGNAAPDGRTPSSN